MAVAHDWTEHRLGDVIKRAFSGPSPTCEERNVRGEEWGVLKTTCSTADAGWDPTKHKVLPIELWGMSHLEVRPGDSIITKAGPRHRVAVPAFVSHVRPRIIPSGKMICLRPDPTKIEPGFLALALADRRTQSYLDQRTTGMAESQVNYENADLLSAPLWLPSLEDQRRIMDPLDEAHSLIAALERMIAKKQAIKQGMMQQLLTGKTRLPGFTEPWHEVALDALATVDPEALSAGTNPRTMLDYISLEDVERGELLGHTRMSFGSAPSRARRVIQESDVLFGTVRPNLQSHTIYCGGLRHPIASTGFAVVRADAGRSDPRFLYYVLMSHLTTVQVDRIIAGSNYPAVSSRDLRGLVFSLPPVDEQRAIGSALADCDDEVSVLKNRLVKARAVKAGMMQELLTGRTRLPVEEGAA